MPAPCHITCSRSSTRWSPTSAPSATASVCLNGGGAGDGRTAGTPAAFRARRAWRTIPRLPCRPGNCARFIRWPRAAPRREVRARMAFIEQSANRRLARDCERMESYYGGLLAQLEKRAARRAAGPQAAEKEHSRIAATQLDRAAKLEDLVRKYSLRVQLELTDVLVASLPVRAISVKLMRKKEERPVTLAWNALLRALDTPLCESCSGRARPLHLCDKVGGKMHLLCGACWSACPACGRVFCKACQAKCKCGAGA